MQVSQHRRMQYLRVRRHVRAQHQRELNRDRTDLLELLDRILDKGVLIEGRARVPVLGLEVLTLDVRAFVASCEKYLQYAHAVTQTVCVGEADEDTTDTMDTDVEQSTSISTYEAP